MLFLKKINKFEKGLKFRNREFLGVLSEGKSFFCNPFAKERIDVVDIRKLWLKHDQLEMMVKSQKLQGELEIIELLDNQRALIWLDNKFHTILNTGLYALWTGFYQVKIEILTLTEAQFQHEKLNIILNAGKSNGLFDEFQVKEGFKGIYFEDGTYKATLEPGRYAFFKNYGKVKLYHKDTREQSLDVSGQDIMTSDKVTLRINAQVSFRINDVVKSVLAAEAPEQVLYRHVQLALREIVGTKNLDEFLLDKDMVAKELARSLNKEAHRLGLEIISFGIRDIILPGEMKALLNKVTEAKKAAEANLIARREETAAMRSQANTARMLSSNPAVIKLRELEILDKLASNSNLNLVLGEKGISEKISKML
ncbi:MAG: slipin family protein [Spirochaetes bacterium]|nr:slipin family protein [Spirochaetota bacterium]